MNYSRYTRSCGGRVSVLVMGIVLICMLRWPAAADAERVDRIVASVNNAVITLSELRQAVVFNQVLGAQDDGRKLAIKTLEGIVNRKLLLQEAYRLRIVDVSGQEVSSEIDRFRNRLGSEQAFQDYLDRSGTSYAQFMRGMTEQLLVRRFVERKIALYARVGREDVEAYYREHAADFDGKRFPEVQARITELLSRQMVAQQLDGYLAELRARADIRTSYLEAADGF